MWRWLRLLCCGTSTTPAEQQWPVLHSAIQGMLHRVWMEVLCSQRHLAFQFALALGFVWLGSLTTPFRRQQRVYVLWKLQRPLHPSLLCDCPQLLCCLLVLLLLLLLLLLPVTDLLLNDHWWL